MRTRNALAGVGEIEPVILVMDSGLILYSKCNDSLVGLRFRVRLCGAILKCHAVFPHLIGDWSMKREATQQNPSARQVDDFIPFHTVTSVTDNCASAPMVNFHDPRWSLWTTASTTFQLFPDLRSEKPLNRIDEAAISNSDTL